MNKRKDCLKIKTLLKCLPLILVSSCQAWSPAPESDLLEYELKGDVASMRNTSYNLDSTADGYKVTGIETSMSNLYVEFDSAGRKTLLQRFGKDMRPGVREEYTYNGDGQIETKSVIMSDGAVREKSVYSYVRGRLHSLTVTDGSDSLKKYEKDQAKLEQLQKAAAKLHLWAFMGNDKLHKRAFSIEKRMEKLEKTEKPREAKKLRAAFRTSEFRADEVLVAENLSKGFGGRPLFSGVEFKVTGGERIAIIGDNGTGKSTLIKLIVGEEAPDAGYVRSGPAVRMAYLPQLVTFRDPSLSAADTVIDECRCEMQEARDRLGAFGFTGEDALKAVGTLSGGEQSRLRLCILMRADVNLLILDEPTNHLDIPSREWMEDALADYDEALLFVSHDRYFIEKFATRIWHFAEGRITDFRGSFGEYREYRARQEAIAQAQKSAAPKQEKPKSARRRTSELEKQRRRVEREIEKTEARLAEIDAESEANASDYVRLMELDAERNELNGRLDALYSEWEELDES